MKGDRSLLLPLRYFSFFLLLAAAGGKALSPSWTAHVGNIHHVAELILARLFTNYTEEWEQVESKLEDDGHLIEAIFG